MARGYFTTKISDNLEETPEGNLIAPGCVIARTGWQQYLVKDLPQQAAEDLGVDVSNPQASINLYRRSSDVFDPDTLRSFEGKAVTDNHPPEFVDPTNFNEYARGHIQNVRAGTEPLDSGDMPMLGDIHITAEPLLSKVRNKQVRELSCGYDFSIERDGDKICQTDIVGNHVAVVPKGRAGEEARINDAAPAPEDPAPEHTEPVYKPIVIPPLPTKEKHVATKHSWLRSLMGKHLIEMARANDADPEKIMEAAKEMTTDEDEHVEDRHADDKHSRDRHADDKHSRDRHADDKHSRDRHADDDSDENEFNSAAEDRKRLHDALDRMMNDKRRAKDTDLEELKALLNEFFTEEEEEPEHAADDEKETVEEELDTTPIDETLATDEDLCPECKEPMDDCMCEDDEDDPGQELVESGEEELAEDDLGDEPDEDHEPAADKRRARDRARAADGAMAVLATLRPVVARTGDAAVRKAFNTALGSVKRGSRPSTGGYGAFARAARARDKAPHNPNPSRSRATDAAGKAADPNSKLQAAYDAALKGGK